MTEDGQEDMSPMPVAKGQLLHKLALTAPGGSLHGNSTGRLEMLEGQHAESPSARGAQR